MGAGREREFFVIADLGGGHPYKKKQKRREREKDWSFGCATRVGKRIVRLTPSAGREKKGGGSPEQVGIENPAPRKGPQQRWH